MTAPVPPRPSRAGVPVMTRRTLLWDLGGSVAFLATAACTSGSPTAGSSAGASSAAGPTTGAATDGATGGSTGSSPDPDTVEWERVLGGASSAYVLVRGGEATIVDTGQAGTELAIQDGLEALGMSWEDVSSVILTHRHPDHVGSLDEVAARAGQAQLLAGEADIEAIAGPRAVAAIGNGSRVMDLEVLETPGHTPGHVSVFDSTARLLVAGDAINGTEDGGVAGPNPSFTPDMDTAWTSAMRLAELRPDMILFGHGPPATSEAAADLDAAVAQA